VKPALFATSALLSLLLCIAASIYWARSYDRCDVLIRQRGPGDRVGMTSEFGVIVFEMEARHQGVIQPTWVYFDKPLPRRWPRAGGFFGFAAYRGAVRHFLLLPPTPLWGITVPHGFVATAAAALPLAWLAKTRRASRARRRIRSGLCPACGYDLRASAERCPECGQVVHPT
jgi:hypothetical protein